LIERIMWTAPGAGSSSMTFWQAIGSGFSNYVKFRGRALRPEFWYWALFTTIGDFAGNIIDVVLGSELISVSSLFALATLLPTLALLVRRLHDVDRTGWWAFMLLFPLIGVIVLVILVVKRGTPGANRFGPDPLAGGSIPLPGA
jgi:uncharacterized membrane protein YhaH (DUF805 family)